MKEFARYMRYGKLVQVVSTSEVYYLVADMDGEKETVQAVNRDNLERFRLLTAWVQNWEQNSIGFRDRFTDSGKDIEECKGERQGYVEEVNIADLSPYNTIRFITSNYVTKFEVRDLTCISVDGVVARVAYLDETHFTFVDKIGMTLYGGCLHICQFAEICEKNGREVKAVEE